MSQPTLLEALAWYTVIFVATWLFLEHFGTRENL